MFDCSLNFRPRLVILKASELIQSNLPVKLVESFWLQFIDKESIFSSLQNADRYSFMDFRDGSAGDFKSLSFNKFGWRKAAESSEKHGIVCESRLASRKEHKLCCIN